MNNSNIFKEIKQYLSPQQVAAYYLQGKGKRSGNNVFYKSPFRNEKTASFCVNNEKGFHDYGDGWHGDIISFVQELYHISPIDAAKTLIQDFALPIEIGQKANYKQIKNQRHKTLLNKKIRDALEKWFNNIFIKLCDENKINEICIDIISKTIKSIDNLEKEENAIALQYLYYRQTELNLWIDEFINVTTEDEKLELFRHRKEIEKIWT